MQGNLKTFLQLTHLKLDGTRVRFDPSWYREIQGYIQNNPTYSPSLSNTHGISVQAFCNTLNEVLREQGLDPTITTGVGVHQMVAAQRIDAVSPNQFLTSGSLGTMGVAIPFAVGAQFNRPGQLIIAIEGDGGFNMSSIELKTLMDQKLPIKLAIVNNNSEMMVEFWQKLFYEKRYIGTSNDNQDYGLLAQSFGIESIACGNASELKSKIHLWLSSPGASILNLITEKTPCLPLVKPGCSIENMITNDDDYLDLRSGSDEIG